MITIDEYEELMKFHVLMSKYDASKFKYIHCNSVGCVTLKTHLLEELSLAGYIERYEEHFVALIKPYVPLGKVNPVDVVIRL